MTKKTNLNKMSMNIRKETYLTFDEVGHATKKSVWNVYSDAMPDVMVGSGFKTRELAIKFKRERDNNI